MSQRELKIDCGYPGFEVRADRRTYATTPYRGTLLVSTTTRTLSFRRSGYEIETHLLEGSQIGTISCHPQLSETALKGEAGKLVLSVNPQDAKVNVNGQTLALATGLHLPLGEHLVEVSKEGYVSRTVLVRVGPGSSVFEEIRLRPVGSALSPEEEPQTTWTSSRILGLTFAGLGVGVGGTALGVFAWNDQRHDRWKTERAELENAPLDQPGLREARRANNTDLQKIQRTDTTTWILGASAVALVAAGTLAYFFEFPESPTTVGIGPSSFHLETAW